MAQLHAPERVVVNPDGALVVCSCQWQTPTFGQARDAMLHIEQHHPLTTPKCMLCERQRMTLPGGRFAGLRVLTDRSTDEQFLVCVDEVTCRRLTQRLVERVTGARSYRQGSASRRRRTHLRLVT